MNDVRTAIMEHPFFGDMTVADLEVATHAARKVTFEAGEVLFREGEPANRLFLIQKGTVALEAHEPGDGTALVQELGDGEVLGWSWLFPPYVWHFQARALEPTEAIALDGGHLLAAAEHHPKFGYNLMKRVAKIVIERLQATRKQLLEQQMNVALG